MSNKISTKDKEMVNDFVDSLKNDPKAIIKWAKKEISCYEELINLIENEGCVLENSTLKPTNPPKRK